MADFTPSPTITEFEAMELADSNAWWRLESGDHQNLFDEARGEIARLRNELWDLAWHVQQETEARAWGKPEYDIVHDDLHDRATYALSHLAPSKPACDASHPVGDQ